MSEFSILHVEDSDDDAFLLSRALLKELPFINLQRLPDGRQALDYLSGASPLSIRTTPRLPNLMLLDLKLPQVDGFEVLSFVRSQAALAHLRVFILSSSDLPEDVERARTLGANGYFVKSARFSDVVKAVATQFEVCQGQSNTFTTRDINVRVPGDCGA